MTINSWLLLAINELHAKYTRIRSLTLYFAEVIQQPVFKGMLLENPPTAYISFEIINHLGHPVSDLS